MTELNPSLYETLLQNFAGGLDLDQVSEQDQPVLSVLDNLQRILGSRAGALSHLPDYGLPDLGAGLQGVPAGTPTLIEAMAATLLKYEPRLASVSIELLPQALPGYVELALEVQLKGGRRASFGTTLAPGGKTQVRYPASQNNVLEPLTDNERTRG
ncbi:MULTISPECIES: type VI secretion system baseplate subunit TssE [Pseudomonas]|uniref:type VI secretion system baseplate subunit TssE n=1 Tax=Pseudomonas TaxID=286 RepID=UPI001BE9659F|nr:MULTISPECIES: type VI secretion system baseplate subunit TssE [Pseudomonas]MBT2339765.1 type VI secretion system baseplate subunit TssE [Pseudomonas fluorescens]MCD4528551.1 type VI secretion system baseplate subunit TssE [Pseudomonas sp. C3-2018]